MNIIEYIKNTQEPIILTNEMRAKLLEEINDLICKKEHVIILKNNTGNNVIYSLNRHLDDTIKIDSYKQEDFKK